MTSSEFWKNYRDTIIRPETAFNRLVQNSGSVKPGAAAVLISALLYTAVYVFLILGHGLPFKPWLAIDPEIYYHYNVFFCLPSMYLGWVLAAGVTQILARWSGGKGSFEQVLLLYGFSIGVANWSTGAHDLITSFLGATGIIDQNAYEKSLNSPTIWRTLLWIQMSIYLVWFTWLFSRAVRISHQLNGWMSGLIGLTGFVVYQLFFLIFNR